MILRCLRKRSADRYRDARELRVALEQLAMSAAGGRPSVAVLPFVNMSPDQDQLIAHRRAIDEDPLNLIIRVGHAVSLRAAGRAEEAATEARRLIEFNPEFAAAYNLQALDVTAVPPEEALGYAERGLALARTRPNIGLLAGVLWRQGQEARARDLIASLESTAYETPVALTIFHALCNDPEEAARWFDRAVDQRHPFVPMLLLTPPYLPVLRASSRWPTLARRVNVSETS